MNTDISLKCIELCKNFPVLNDLKLRKLLFETAKPKDVIKAINNINLEVPTGQILGVLGGNGAGKSTLLRTLSGVYSPSSGNVFVSGELSGMFELGGIGNRFITGREFSNRYLMLLGIKKNIIGEVIDAIMEFSELGEYFDKMIYTYSSGMAARLYFSVATAIQYDIYLIDEMLAVGDEHFKHKCWKRLRERLVGGASGILVTHDWSAVIKLCEKSVVLKKGEIVSRGSSNDIVVSYLNLPKPETEIAKFVDLENYYSAKSNEDAIIEFKVEVESNEPILLSYSVEKLEIGLGWEIVILQNDLPITSKKGIYAAKLTIPKTPLSPGKFYINLFLISGNDKTRILDSRSWTNGNALPFNVTGEMQDGLTILPMKWKFA